MPRVCQIIVSLHLRVCECRNWWLQMSSEPELKWAHRMNMSTGSSWSITLHPLFTGNRHLELIWDLENRYQKEYICWQPCKESCQRNPRSSPWGLLMDKYLCRIFGIYPRQVFHFAKEGEVGEFGSEEMTQCLPSLALTTQDWTDCKTVLHKRGM